MQISNCTKNSVVNAYYKLGSMNPRKSTEVSTNLTGENDNNKSNDSLCNIVQIEGFL